MEVAQVSKQPWLGLVNKAPFTQSGQRAGQCVANMIFSHKETVLCSWIRSQVLKA